MEERKNQLVLEGEAERDRLMKEFFDSLLEGHPGLLEAHPETAKLLETCYKVGFVNGINVAVEMMEKVHEEMFGNTTIDSNKRR